MLKDSGSPMLMVSTTWIGHHPERDQFAHGCGLKSSWCRICPALCISTTENRRFYFTHINLLPMNTRASERASKRMTASGRASSGTSKWACGRANGQAQYAIRKIIYYPMYNDIWQVHICCGFQVEDRTPYIVVAFQECERMNQLTAEIRRSLKELDLGLKGELTITADMEELSTSLYMGKLQSW